MEGGESCNQTERERERERERETHEEEQERSCRKKRLSLQHQDRGQTQDQRLHADQNRGRRPGAAQSTMSESIRRKSSSRQLLQNLISVTAQRSQEDAEEVERERRRRSRETQRGEGGPSRPEAPQHNELPHNTESDEALKPRCCLVLEEDEGFSDWSHRLENRGEQEVQEVQEDCRAGLRRPLTQRWKAEPEEEKRQEGEEEEEQDGYEPERSSRHQEASSRPPEKTSVDRKEVRMSYSSTVFLSQDARLQHAVGQPADRTSYLVAGTMRPCGGACRVDAEVQQEVQREVQEMRAAPQREPAGTIRSPRDEDDQEEEELSFTHEEKEDLHLRREEKHREEEEEEHGMPDKSLAESRRSEEVNRRSAASLCCSSEGEEPLNYGPMSPTFKKLLIQFYPDEVNNRLSTDSKCSIVERTESLRRSSSVKKMPPPVAVSKIDKKLEMYTHALEVSTKEGRSGSQALTDLTSHAEPVSSKKSLFEAGEAWSQNAVSVSPSKDADGLKVGVANLINQWVKGSEDGSRCSSPSRAAESSSGKRYKFVVTGHGKYEKASGDNDCSEDANCPSAGQFFEDL